MPVEDLHLCYLRLSLEDDEKTDGSVIESVSISSQRECLRQYTAEHFPGIQFEEIVDDGFSGTNMNRPGMRRLLQLVAAGRVRTIIVRDLSRFARNYLEAGRYLEVVFPSHHVRFISVNDGYDSTALDEATGGLAIAIRNILNEMYSRDISRKIKSVVDMKKLRGEFVYGTAPFGYQKGTEPNTVSIDQTAADTVQQIFSWAAEGVSVTQIARSLNEAHTMTPSQYLAPRRGNYPVYSDWSYESVRHILRNRFYTGDTIPFKSRVVSVGSNRTKYIPAGERTIISHTHEGIISYEQFEKAQKTIKSVPKQSRSISGNPLRATLVCACCGHRLVKGKDSNKMWLCASARYQSDSPCHTIRMEDAELQKVVLHAIVSQCQLISERVEQLYKTQENKETRRQFMQKDLQRLQQQLRQQKARSIQAYEDYVAGILTKDTYLSKKQKLILHEQDITEQIATAEEALHNLQNTMQSDREQLMEAQPMVGLRSVENLTQELVQSLIQRITVYPDRHILIEWNFSDSIKGLLSE